MSDKSASLREATEQLAELKRQLAEAQAAAEAAGARAEGAAAELEQSHARAMGLATSLADVEGQLEAHRAEAAAQAEALAAAQAEAEAQRAAVEAVRQELAAVQQGTLLEKEQQVGGWCRQAGGDCTASEGAPVPVLPPLPTPSCMCCPAGASCRTLPQADPAASLCPPALPPRSSLAGPSCRSCAHSWRSRRRRPPGCAPSWRREMGTCRRPRQPWLPRWPRPRSRCGGRLYWYAMQPAALQAGVRALSEFRLGVAFTSKPRALVPHSRVERRCSSWWRPTAGWRR